jgi:PRTRC genetic system ThiF family protein
MTKAAFDLSYTRAASVLARISDREALTLVLVGCGGTGSYMAMHLGRVMKALSERGQPVNAMFIDPDYVEPKNIGRQLFCEAETGLPKAQCLALRYGSAWGLDIEGHVTRFDSKMLKQASRGLCVIVGCVDNAAGRKEMSKVLTRNQVGRPAVYWWLDCGNHEDSGQVILGSAAKAEDLKGCFQSARICQALPSPALVSPELLKAKRVETAAAKMSCAELTAANLQSLNINAAIAVQAADMLTRLLVTRDLKRYQCAVNLASGSVKSYYVTPEEIAREIGRPVEFVVREKARAAAA